MLRAMTAITFAAATLLLSTQAGAIIVYQDDFSGAGALDGATPDVAPAGTHWAAGGLWNADGTKPANGHSNMLLPFTPQAGNQYTLSAVVNPDTSGSDDWFALGFTNDIDRNGGWHPAANNNAIGWMLNRENDASGSAIQTFLGPVTAGGASHDLNPDVAGPIELQVILDTTAPNWNVVWLANGVPLRVDAFASNPSINYVGVGAWNTATGVIESFTLDAAVEDLPPALHFTDGQKLLNDTFNVIPPGNPDTFDVLFNLNQRQAGSALGTVGYNKMNAANHSQVGNNITSDKVVIQDGNAMLLADAGGVELDFNFNGVRSQGGLSVSFDAAPAVRNGQGSGDWVSVGFGFDQGAAPPFSINTAVPHFGILFRENGDWQAFDGSAAIATGTFDAGALPDTLLRGFEVVMTDPTDDNPFDGAGQTTFDVYYQGTLLFSHTEGNGGFANNYINFQSIGISYIDNLMIRGNAPVPEPASLMLLGVGGLALLRRRRAA